ncbi:tRNA (adenosine(37)-N6)-threonylcarbamoyltransferase complex ATPase subunit type 1 TsaE [Methylocella sp.]|uniref:tRNA (adenosine(37)-N6)-threonylcarbamoyltransferase complex ATPase subunit type 1 TsaE n=1 Tax=Methylocella sp. TaxID=1978226 RepID=UPI003782EA85
MAEDAEVAPAPDQAPPAGLGAACWTRRLPDEAATARLADEIAELIEPGDLVALSGELGAGKTTFARALIRRLSGDAEIEAPSPTFLLMQLYEGRKAPIVHADFYRLESPEELVELGFDEAVEGAFAIVEWPERGGGRLSPDRLDVSFALDPEGGEEARTATVSGRGAFAERLARVQAIEALLAPTQWRAARRDHMQGDASSRAFERLVTPDGATAVLMISPPRPDGPPIRFGKPYSAIARLAEDARPFVAVDRALRGQGLSAPEIYAFNLETGVVLLEDLGTEGVLADGAPDFERYELAARALAKLHASDLPDVLEVEDGDDYVVPPYDLDALLIEVELFLDWWATHRGGLHLSSGARATFVNIWKRTLNAALTMETTWTLRDYHSPNLIWLARREGLAKVGLVDFQDCVMGHPAYDVVSLLQDARVDVPEALELKLLGAYARARREFAPGAAFDLQEFARAYAALGAQRATKILGIFARLDARDRKPHYLAHLPRVERYLQKNLRHESLAEIRAWFRTHAPKLAGEA